MPEPQKQFLDFEDTLVLKGLAILAIVFHNFYHRIGVVKENELAFDPQHFPVFLAQVTHPTQTFQAWFSYLGHFGVQIFIFLSAYGLALKYYPLEMPWAKFLTSRVKKIYPMYFLAVLLWIFFLAGMGGPSGMLDVLGKNWSKLILAPLALINWVPHLGLPPVGPWWFLPFILQFYLLWPLFVKFSRRFGAIGLWTLALASLVIVSLLRPVLFAKWEINLQLSPFGHIPEICLGILMARFGYRISPIQAACAAVLFVAGNIYYPLWLVTFATVPILSLFVYQRLRPLARKARVFAAVGSIAMPVFFINGIVRVPLLDIASRHANQWGAILLLGLLSTAISLGLGAFLDRIESGFRWPEKTAPVPQRARA